MKVKINSLENKSGGEIELKDSIFGLAVRRDILFRMVEWQRAKKRSGNHKTKVISEVSGTTKKPFAQKGTGRARQGSLRGPHMKGGSVIHGPVVRSHAHDLTKKFRKLGLKTALSSKLKEGKLHIFDNVNLKSPKMKELSDKLGKLGFSSVLFIDGDKLDENFTKAAKNLKYVDVLPHIGANVYDILKHKDVVLTVDALKKLEERLS